MLEQLQRLVNGKGPVYVATYLFEHTGRYFGARLERACRTGLLEGLKQLGFSPKEPITFLPYRDSNGAIELSPGESFTKAIFCKDIERLANAFALIAPLYHTQFDAGICFEIGFAAGRGLPTIVLLTNNYQYRYFERLYRLPPLLELMANQVLEEGEFPLTELAGQPEVYLDLIEAALQRIEKSLGDTIGKLILHPSEKPWLGAAPANSPNRRVFLEFGGGEFEFQRMLAADVRKLLEKDGWQVLRAKRYELLPEVDLLEGAKKDLQEAISSDVVVILGDGSDANPESAALQGYLYALGRKIVLYYSGKGHMHGSDEYNMPRNLMLQHSASRIVASSTGIASAIAEVICADHNSSM